MPMEEVVRAHTMMEKNEQVGKIVLTMEWIVCCEQHLSWGERGCCISIVVGTSDLINAVFDEYSIEYASHHSIPSNKHVTTPIPLPS